MLRCPKCLRPVEASYAVAVIHKHKRRLICPICGTFLHGNMYKKKVEGPYANHRISDSTAHDHPAL